MKIVRVSVVLSAIFLSASVARAQATRTWVSGVGDDANPCSRTAPCKTFAGAISKTAPAGEIDTLDPGGFGALTITKAITIDGTAGLAGVLVSGTNGIVISAGSTDVVTLRNLDLNGLNASLSGISILSAGDVRIENCKIYGFSRGVSDGRSAGKLAISNTAVHDNQQTGVLVYNGGSTAVSANLNHVEMHGNGNAGFAITGGAQAIVTNSSATSNVHGFYADSQAVLNVDHSTSFGNSATGINVSSEAIIRLYDSTITANGMGLAITNALVLSYGLNRISGNITGNGPVTGTITLQ